MASSITQGSHTGNVSYIKKITTRDELQSLVDLQEMYTLVAQAVGHPNKSLSSDFLSEACLRSFELDAPDLAEKFFFLADKSTQERIKTRVIYSNHFNSNPQTNMRLVIRYAQIILEESDKELISILADLATQKLGLVRSRRYTGSKSSQS